MYSFSDYFGALCSVGKGKNVLSCDLLGLKHDDVTATEYVMRMLAATPAF